MPLHLYGHSRCRRAWWRPEPLCRRRDGHGLGNCYKIESANVEGNKVTVTFPLKSAFTNYQELKNAVESTGGAGPQMDPLSDSIELTIPGFTLSNDAVANGDELTVTGDVNGSFGAVAIMTGKVKPSTSPGRAPRLRRARTSGPPMTPRSSLRSS